MLGYGLLALAYGYGFRLERRKLKVAWLLAVLYALTDELHQSFVPGRHASWVDALLFDNLGAALVLYYVNKKLPTAKSPSHEA